METGQAIYRAKVADESAVEPKQFIKEWIVKAFEVALEVYPYTNNLASREEENVRLRNAVMVISYWRWGKHAGSVFIGEVIADCVGKKIPYSHCTVLHSIREHKNRLQFPNANAEYVAQYTTFREQIKERGLI